MSRRRSAERRPRWHYWLLLVVVCALSSLLMVQPGEIPDLQLSSGTLASRDVRAPSSFEFTDEETTEWRRREAEDSVALVFDHDLLSGERTLSRFREHFSAAQELQPSPAGVATPEAQAEAEAEEARSRAEEFCSALDLKLTEEELGSVADSGWSLPLQQAVEKLLSTSNRWKIVGTRETLPPSGAISILEIREGGRAEYSFNTLDEITTLDDARRRVALEALVMEEGETRRVAVTLAMALLKPNLTPNALLTEERRAAARDAVAPAVYKVSRGTTIIRQGDLISPQQMAMFEMLREDQGDRSPLKLWSSLFAFSLLFLWTLTRFASTYIRKFSTSVKDLTATGFLLLLALGLARLASAISQTMTLEIGAVSLWFLVPVAGLALLVRILINSETSLVFAMGTATLCGLMMEQELVYTIFFLTSSVVATGALGREPSRASILRTGLLTGIFSASFILLYETSMMQLQPQASGDEMLWHAGMAFLGGILGSFLVLGLLPLFEQAGFVTDLQLLELGSLQHPLLRNLMFRAVGSYNHSVAVGTLAEAASEKVGCNALQARVCSYFHDIGKAENPKYFIENQRPGQNPHDELSPWESARVILRHVTQGAEMARAHKLPQPIIDAILMHHGSGVIRHFYKKALEIDPEARVEDFRYPGPRPNTREQGIIMLADKVEAACRAIQEPTPERVSGLIQRITNGVIQDGQFEECPLTVGEIRQVAETFQSVILGLHHQRVEYPETSAITSGDMEVVSKPPSDAVITLEIPGPDTGEVEPPPPYARSSEAGS